MLAVGDTAPDFEATTLRGATVRLRDWRGKPTWLAFFRFAACPLCNYRVHSMIEVWKRFAGRDFGMLAVFQSPKERLEEFVAQQEPQFDLVADPEMELYRLYELETSWLAAMKPSAMGAIPTAKKAGFPILTPRDGPANRVPGDYLIGRTGTIEQVHRGKSIADHIPLDTVDEFLTAHGA